MKIGIDARMLFFTGIGRHILNLLKNVPPLDPDSDYTAFIRPRDRKEAEQVLGNLLTGPKANLTLIDTIDSYYNLAEQTAHLRILNKARLDLLHVPHFNIPVRYKGRLVVTIHDLIQAHIASQETWKARLKRHAYRYVISQALSKAAHVITVSDYTRQDIVRTFGTAQSRIQVIHNGIDRLFRGSDPHPTDSQQVFHHYRLKTPYLLYVGLSSPHKNLLRLVEAMHIVNRELDKAGPHHDKLPPQLQLVIAGKKDPRYTPQIQEKIHNLNLRQQVHLLGFVPDQDLRILYQCATAFVFPSLYEGFGIPPLEAMSVGLPVLSSFATALPEVLGDQAVYFDPNKASEIAEKILMVIQDPARFKPKKLPDYNWQKMARETLSVYRKVLAAS